MGKAWRSSGSRHQRGYGTAWDKLRLVILQRDLYLCQCDQCRGGDLRMTAASHVDHIKPKAQGGTDDPSNLRAVSKDCHRRISMEQRGFTPQRRIGLDGYPVM